MIDSLENRYFNEFRKSEYVYTLRDITDHLKSVRYLYSIIKSR